MSIDDFEDGFSYDSYTLDSYESDDMIGNTIGDDEIDIPLIRQAEQERTTKPAGQTLPSDMENNREDTDAYNHVCQSSEPTKVVYKSKMEHAEAIYLREKAKGPVVRKVLIGMFQKEAACTPGGSSTYFQTLKTKHGG